MELTDDHTALAAEYALGTLDADERAQVELTMAANPDFAALVQSWELRLSVLHQMVGSVEPPPEVWERIKIAAGLIGRPPLADTATRTAVPDASASPAEPSTLPPSGGESGSKLSPESMRVVHFAVRARLWRWTATATGALAASFAAIIVAQVYQPNVLPDALRPAVRTQIVRVAAPPPPSSGQFVALLQKDASSPAFILTVDAATKRFTVRQVGAAQEPGKSYELWLVSDKLQRPRSLGVIGGDEFTTRAALAAFDDDTMHRATYAVTLEPEGGSPTGVATGPIVFTGKLMETVPQGASGK